MSTHTKLAPLTLALRLAFGGAIALTAATSAYSQTAPAQYDIPAGPLMESLNRFAQQSGVAIALDADKVQDLRSPGLKGSYSVEEGFNALLRDTPYVIGKTSAGYVLQNKPASQSSAPRGDQALAPVTVNSTLLADELPAAYAGGQVARGAQLGILGSGSTMDTPFNITAYTAGLIEDQQAATVGAVLLNDPSVRFTTSEGHIYENFSIRGFDINAEELAYNGLYGLSPYGHAPTEFIERVEVLKGPGALLGGMSPQGGVGGVINLIPKRAGDKPLLRLTTDYTSDAQYGVQVDAGRRFGEHGEYGVRFNGGYRDGKAGVDDQKKKRELAAIALDYRGTQLTASLDAYTDREEIDNGSSWMASFASAVGVIAPPKTGTNLLRGIDGSLDNKAVLLRGSYEIDDTFTAYAALGQLNYRYDGYINGTRASITNAAGDYKGATYNQRGTVDTTSGEVGLRARFVTGPVKHQMVASYTSLEYDTGRANVSTSASYNSNIYNPVTPTLASDPGAVLKVGDTALHSYALADTLSFADDKLLLIVGARSQQVKTRTYNGSTGAITANYDKRALTPSVGVVLKPWSPAVSLYANYIEGLSQGGSVTDTTAANYGTVFAPYKSKQLEGGVKWDQGEYGNTFSVFRIERPSMIKDTATNTYTDDGQQRNRGVEWNTFGQLGGQLRLLGGVTYTDAKMTRAATAALTGKTIYGTPKWKANLGGDWSVPGADGLVLNARVIYTGSQYVNSANTQMIDSWTRLDVGARYGLRVQGHPVQLRANVENVADKSYWAGSFNDGYVTQGAGRTFKLSASVDF
ncbi:TonB-dependent siderophore receptor [Duganella sp. FT80W]|uniref:TonB-dependent siderophore receptor n=1 Tax=Duganella guangzhouensis TaxID=2666084 RepID=A0A6I2KUL3_9BURK|nr:TonB-dependent receptor [Duganella guangzhouensis]MRW89568.1 TonB-dependent siderophore receptor [Duganella guangzhouensis]